MADRISNTQCTVVFIYGELYTVITYFCAWFILFLNYRYICWFPQFDLKTHTDSVRLWCGVQSAIFFSNVQKLINVVPFNRLRWIIKECEIWNCAHRNIQICMWTLYNVIMCLPTIYIFVWMQIGLTALVQIQ